ncbi:unnamed protein product [Oikopleura dioica]|uniref:Uncharacterized protein n=1 Tax=Oikopleura dioica TaxID=34765 RepID=E4X7Z5_OIKDI|nr:unnamed protein product [Oikopleura dioica]CBY33508.1 unnamed protein product [Oikopleura dioica]
MARSLEELPRSLTGMRLGWSAVALLVSFVVALSVSIYNYPYPCVGLPICFGIGGVGQLWDLVGHIMYIQDLWRPWLRGLKLFVWVGYLLLLSSLGCLIAFVVMAHLEGVSDWHFCSWNAAALGTIWPIVSAMQLIFHSKLYRSEFRELRALLDY